MAINHGKRKCCATGCGAMVAPRLLMCWKHWKMVPGDVQREVWRTYRPGQEHGGNIAADYITAARNAIRAVAAREGNLKGDDIPTEQE